MTRWWYPLAGMALVVLIGVLMLQQPVAVSIAGFIVGYFVIGEWLLGTVFGLGRHHTYWWEW